MIRLLTIQNLIYQRNLAQMKLFQSMNNWDELGVLQSSLELKCIKAQLDSLQGKKLDTLA